VLRSRSHDFRHHCFVNDANDETHTESLVAEVLCE
jgi:hypothetical protein